MGYHEVCDDLPETISEIADGILYLFFLNWQEFYRQPRRRYAEAGGKEQVLLPSATLFRRNKWSEAYQVGLWTEYAGRRWGPRVMPNSDIRPKNVSGAATPGGAGKGLVRKWCGQGLQRGDRFPIALRDVDDRSTPRTRDGLPFFCDNIPLYHQRRQRLAHPCQSFHIVWVPKPHSLRLISKGFLCFLQVTNSSGTSIWFVSL